MKKKGRIQIASQIIAQLRKEMQKPRLTESVRSDLSIQTSNFERADSGSELSAPSEH
jgi:hypothetical protein